MLPPVQRELPCCLALGANAASHLGLLNPTRSTNNAQQCYGAVHAPPKRDAEPRSSPEQCCQEAMGGKRHGLLCSHGKLPPAGRCATARAGAAALMVLGCCCACRDGGTKLAALSPVCTSADTATGRSAGLGAAVFAKEICSLPTSPRCPRRPAERLTRSCSICSAASSPMVSSQLPNPSFPYEKKCKTCSNAATSGRRASRSWGGRGSSAGHCSQPPLGREGTVLAEMLRHCPFPRLIAILGRGGWDSKS